MRLPLPPFRPLTTPLATCSPLFTQPGDVSRIFTAVGIVCGFLSTFFAHGFLTIARQAISEGKAVKRSFLVQNLVRLTGV